MSERLVETEEAIATYRLELEAEAALAKGDIAELEDHLRMMIDDLRATGITAEQAVAQARARLGDPKLVAREHARVRSSFGVRLSRARSWSAAALFATQLAIGFGYFGLQHPYALVELGLGVALVIALVSRLTWARAAMMGAMGYGLAHTVVFFLVVGPPDAINVALTGLTAGTLAFVMPWRRGELGLAGLALAMLGAMYAGSNWVLGFEMTSPTTTIEMISAQVAMVATITAGAGIVMRARWAAIAAAVSAIHLAVAARVLLDMTFRFENADALRALLVGTVALGAAAAAACAVLAWRSAHTRFGSLRGFAV